MFNHGGVDWPFGAELRALLRNNLAAHRPRQHPLDGRRLAAVAVVIVDSDAERHGHDPGWDTPARLDAIPGVEPGSLSGLVSGTAGGPAFLLTRRTGRLNRHAGQWALPGGRVDPGEEPLAAARREAAEELGLNLAPDDLLGQLDDYPTRSGYLIRPYVFWGGADPDLVPDPGEVASVHRISLRELCRGDSPRMVSIPESDRPVIQLPIGGDLIHAPTAAVLYQFRLAAIEADSSACDHFEQPVFAWG
ncbi:MAG: NUDIX hydrolase [Acidimicrobiales bacterium]